MVAVELVLKDAYHVGAIYDYHGELACRRKTEE